jgi:hypothetical protein
MLCSAEAGAQPVNPYPLTRRVGVNGAGASMKIIKKIPQ